MKFDDFIQCCVMLRSLTEGFKRLDTNRSGTVTISYEQVSDFVSRTFFSFSNTPLPAFLPPSYPLTHYQFLELAIDNTL